MNSRRHGVIFLITISLISGVPGAFISVSDLSKAIADLRQTTAVIADNQKQLQSDIRDATSASSTDHGEDVQELKTKINDHVSESGDTLDQLKESNTKLRSDLDSANTVITELQNSVETLTSAVEQLKTDLPDLIRDRIKTELASSGSSSTLSAGTLVEVPSDGDKAPVVTGTVDAATAAQVNALSTKLAKTETAVQNLETGFANVNDDIKQADAVATATKEKLTTLENKVDDIKTDVGGITVKVSSLEDKNTAIEGSVDRLKENTETAVAQHDESLDSIPTITLWDLAKLSKFDLYTMLQRSERIMSSLASTMQRDKEDMSERIVAAKDEFAGKIEEYEDASSTEDCVGKVNGVYHLTSNREQLIRCWNGGIVIQHRFWPFALNMARSWDDYKNGFGLEVVAGEIWLGLENVYKFLQAAPNGYYLMVNVTLRDSHTRRYTKYDRFSLKDETDDYKITLSTEYESDMYDQTCDIADGYKETFHFGNGTKFSTIDHGAEKKCPLRYGGGFWYSFECGWTHLNSDVGGAWGENLIGYGTCKDEDDDEQHEHDHLRETTITMVRRPDPVDAE